MIQLKKISKAYEIEGAQHQVLNEINLSVLRGEKVAITGGNGAGKSTLLNIIGMVDTADEGEYYFNGNNLMASKVTAQKYRRQHFGYIPQTPSLIRDRSGLYNIALPLLFRGLSREKINSAVNEMASLLDVTDLLGKKPPKMSFGERQKISIARALITNPDILLADEATNSLDSESEKRVMNLIMGYDSLTAIIVTHNTSIACTCHRIISLCQGKIQ